MTKDELQQSLLAKIPLVNHMALEVQECGQQQVILKAGFAENKNHKNTAFGGSLTSLLTLACWSWVTNYLEDRGITDQCNVVIHRSETLYALPVLKEFIATCKTPEPKKLEAFMKLYQRKGVARLKLESMVCEEGSLAVAARFSGEFVAIKKT